MRHFWQFFSLIFFLSLTSFFIASFKPPKNAISAILNPRVVTVSAYIGEPLISLYGYTAPLAEVELSANPNNSAQTKADQNGYFRFNQVYLSASTTEICLVSFDQSKRASAPTCIPAPAWPLNDKIIGPIILSPTLSLSKGTFLKNETIEASGQSMPNTEIEVVFFKAKPTFWQRIWPLALAEALPTYTIKTDQNGNFSFNLPSNAPHTFRLFTQAKFNNSPSPKSPTLTFRVLGLFGYWLEQLKLFWLWLMNLIKSLPSLEFLIVGELIFLLCLLFWPKNKKKKQALLLIEKDIEIYGKGGKIIPSP